MNDAQRNNRNNTRFILIACAIGIVVALIGSVMTAPAKAAEPTKPVHVVTYYSEDGESMDDFALRIAPEAVERSMAIGVSGEICGEFRNTTDARLVIELYTIRKITQCSYARRKGLSYTGLTYHTHVFIGETNHNLLSQKLNNPRFSEEDYAHPGYMVSGRLVTFQKGRGTERHVRLTSSATRG